MDNSKKLFKEAKQILVGGVNSPVRAFKSVNSHPIFFKAGNKAHLYSEDNKTYIDYVMGFGPHLIGHNHPSITTAIQEAATKSTTFGAPTKNETVLAKCIQNEYPSIEKIRFVNSGTESCMSAIRLARGYTKKDIIIKCAGGYHGHADGLLVQAGSGNLTYAQPSSAGIPKDIAKKTCVVEYNNPKQLIDIFTKYKNQIAGMIIEPIAGNMGVIPATTQFLETARQLCDQHKVVLIFDEVMSGFRTPRQTIIPDLICLGKIIGGGLPCGAYGGKKEIMNHISPEGDVYQAGTLSGNPIVMAAGIAMLTELSDNSHYEQALKQTNRLVTECKKEIKQHNIPIQINQNGTMFTLFFSRNKIANLTDVKKTNIHNFNIFHQNCIENNIYLPPSAYEALFMSSAHTDQDIEKTLNIFSASFKKIV